MTCTECGSTVTELKRGADGHFRKACLDCGYEWGPFVSTQREPSGQLALGAF